MFDVYLYKYLKCTAILRRQIDMSKRPNALCSTRRLAARAYKEGERERERARAVYAAHVYNICVYICKYIYIHMHMYICMYMTNVCN